MTLATSASVGTPALEPYLEHLREWCAAGEAGTAERGALIAIGRRQLQLDAWEVARVREASCPEATSSSAATITAAVVALLFKVIDDTQRMDAARDGDVAERYTHQAQLMLDSMLAAGLLEQVGRAVTRAVAAGRMEEARGLTRSLHKLRHESDRLQQILCELGSGNEDPAAPVALFEARPAAEPAHSAVSLEPRPNRAVAAAGTRRGSRSSRREAALAASHGQSLARAPSRGLPSRTRALGTLAGLACIGWAAATALLGPLPGARHGSAPSAMGAPLRSPEVRGPALYAEIDAAVWEALGPAERVALVEAAAGTARGHSLSALVIRDAAGRTLAQWWASAGMRLVEPREVPGRSASGTTVSESPSAFP